MSMTELTGDLTQDEGLRLFVYDDATGLPIKPGTLVKGHPTIGIGRALDVHGLTQDEASVLLQNDVQTIYPAIMQAMPWIDSIDAERAEVLIEMAFNLGLPGLLNFKNTLADVQAGNYAKAAAEMLDSAWATQVGARATRLSKQMETGVHV